MPLLLALSLSLLIGAWVFTNPPSAAPDETAHYVKALGVGGGDLVGKPPARSDMARAVRSEASSLIRSGGRAGTPFNAFVWAWRTSRVFRIPAGAISSGFDCVGGRATLSWACLASGHAFPRTARQLRTYIGSYPPFDYLAPGILARLGATPDTRLLLGRLGMAALALVLLIAAILVSWDRHARGLSLVGLLVATTPMVVFVSSTLSASGPEVAASICFASALFRLVRDDSASRWIWAAFAFSGFVLAVSRQLGPEFIGLIVLSTALLFGTVSIRRLLGRRAATLAWAAVLGGCLLGVLWDLLYGVHPPTRLASVLAVIPSSVKQLPTITLQELGDFGQLDSLMPSPAYFAWLVLLGALLFVAYRVCPRRVWSRAPLLAVGIIGCTVLLSALQRQTGFTFQGRYALPIAILLPLSVGELVRQHASHLSVVTAKRVVLGITATAGVVQFVAWFGNGRRVAVGTDGGWLYAFSGHWRPPLGWLPWMGIALVTLLLYVVAAWSGIPSRTAVDAADTDDSASSGGRLSRDRATLTAVAPRSGWPAATGTLQSGDP